MIAQNKRVVVEVVVVVVGEVVAVADQLAIAELRYMQWPLSSLSPAKGALPALCVESFWLQPTLVSFLKRGPKSDIPGA